MSNINDLGLPQGLPEAWGRTNWPPSSVDFAMAQQDYVHRSLGQISNYYLRPREMTAADLGLPLQYDGKWTDFTMGQDLVWWAHTRSGSATDAPYSFWLGADQ